MGKLYLCPRLNKKRLPFVPSNLSSLSEYPLAGDVFTKLKLLSTISNANLPSFS